MNFASVNDIRSLDSAMKRFGCAYDDSSPDKNICGIWPAFSHEQGAPPLKLGPVVGGFRDRTLDGVGAGSMGSDGPNERDQFTDH